MAYKGILYKAKFWKKGNAAYELLANFDEKPYGSAIYGFIFNGNGIAVEKFPEKIDTFSSNIYIHDVAVENMELETIEIPCV